MLSKLVKNWERKSLFMQRSIIYVLSLVLLAVCMYVGFETKDLEFLGLRGRHEKGFLVDQDKALSNGNSQWIIEQRLDHYRLVISEIQTNIRATAILFVFGLIVLIKNPSDLEIPLLGIQMSRGFIHWIIPVAILYLWIQFGFLLFSAIDSRSSLYTLITEVIEESRVDSNSKVVDGYHSAKNALEDIGIVDAWANWFLGHYSHVKDWQSKCTVGFCLYGVFGTLIGLSHGVMLQLLRAFGQRVPSEKVTASVLIFVCSIMLVLSHLAFGVQLPYAFSMQAWIAIVTVSFLTLARFQVSGDPSSQEISMPDEQQVSG